ncbi:hypothetical protein [Pelagicoccus mobilis]|uniref:Uncharacterized protein n=1 Tax=Pelagicoccus mobilis TaxID=415221 RepID=A0A934RYA0_9BACT|nr:hypothetical protein [Pelagicoccus mobilis]MBK1876084.1 hypothetical protein [Pelagicoccus mobilis]
MNENYELIVLDATLFYPSSGRPDRYDDLNLLRVLTDLKSKHARSKHVVVFDGGEQSRGWRDRQSSIAASIGWLPYYVEGKIPSICIHTLVTLAKSDGIETLVFSSNIEDLAMLSDCVDFVTVDEDGDLERCWTVDRFADAFGFNPSELALVKALGGWSDFLSLVPERGMRLVLDGFQQGRRLAYNGVDLTTEVESRLKILELPDPPADVLRGLRIALGIDSANERSRVDG